MNARQVAEYEIESKNGRENGQIIELTSGDYAVIVRPINDEWLVGIITPDLTEFDLGEYLQTH